MILTYLYKIYEIFINLLVSPICFEKFVANGLASGRDAWWDSAFYRTNHVTFDVVELSLFLCSLDHVLWRQANPDPEHLHEFPLVNDLKYWPPGDHLYHNATERPHVYRISIRDAHDNLWRPIKPTLHVREPVFKLGAG